MARALPGDARESGFSKIDLEESSLPKILDDARSFSLFARDRVIWISSAELALPRRFTAESDDEDNPKKSSEPDLATYLKHPTDGTILVFECSRYDFSGDDRNKLERVQKFYSDVPVTVEFRPLSAEASRYLAQDLAKQHNLKFGGAELAMLLEAVAGDANRLSAEMEKLSLFVGPEASVSENDLRTMVPNASQTTIFNLVNALGKRDRVNALRSLDILVREGEYLPLALTFLSMQFRLALAAKEAKLTNANQAVAFFTKLGVRIWRDRAEQVLATASAFAAPQLMHAVTLIYETDKKFREGYKDDRLVMEGLVLALTTKAPTE